VSIAVGTIVDQRFTLEAQAGTGGMGEVYQAIDSTNGTRVAIKVLRLNEPEAVVRFKREAEVLAALKHRHIVTPITRGVLSTGEPFLAMEWLEGRDLAARLRSGPLSLEDTLLLARHVASALEVAHAHSIVHRDVKPGNLFLCGDRIDRVKLLDFGIARHMGNGATMTRTGMLLGTPYYMAPEQATSGRNVGPPADLFSLGCVLFECLAGQHPFEGEHPMAVLAKIIFEDAPSIRTYLPNINPAVEAFMARLLEKDLSKRFCSASQVIDALDALLLEGVHESSDGTNLPTGGITTDEQEVVCAIVVDTQVDHLDPQSAALSPNDTLEKPTTEHSSWSSLTTLGFRKETLTNGVIVATLSGIGHATDQAARAARGAMLLRDRFPTAHLALATGKARRDGQRGLPVGEVIDRAFRLISQATTNEGILLDDVTTGLLDDRFIVTNATGGALLCGERIVADESKRLLGKPTPCVGRERELGALQSAWNECVEERSARALLYFAPPGTGKSRLRHEFVERLRRTGAEFSLLLGRGEPVATSTLGLLPRALRVFCSVDGADEALVQQSKIRAAMERKGTVVPAPEIVAFLGELAGVSFPDDDLPKLRGARREPRLLAEQMTWAFVEFCRSVCADKPLLIVVEDLHWSDSPSVNMIGAMLRELKEEPIFVLALARPEFREKFPSLWSSRCEFMSLGTLRARAAEQLVREVLGDRAQPEAVRRIVENAEGNALFLEELIRAVAEGRGNDLPKTVLAILQARLGRLPQDVRRTLRAASIFGHTCTEYGVRAVVGPNVEVLRCLTALVEEEILELRRDLAADGDVEYSIRHALVRDAAYQMLLDEDRQLGHRLAAEWLESIEGDAAVIADHFHHAGLNARAVPYCVRAAEQAHSRCDAGNVERFTSLGESCGAEGIDLGHLFALRAMNAIFSKSTSHNLSAAAMAMQLLPPEHSWWFRSACYHCMFTFLTGRIEEGQELAQSLLRVKPRAGSDISYAIGLWMLISVSCQLGLSAIASEALERLTAYVHEDSNHEATMSTWVDSAHYECMRHRNADPWQQCRLVEAAVRAGEEGGSIANYELSLLKQYIATSNAELGAHEWAESMLRASIKAARSTGSEYVVVHGQIHLADILCLRAQEIPAHEVRKLVDELLVNEHLTPGFRAWAHAILGAALLEMGELDAAEAACREAIARSNLYPYRRLRMKATLIRVLVQSGKLEDAVAIAQRATAQSDELGGAGYAEIAIRTAAAIAFHATGDTLRAHQNLEIALREIDRQANSIPEAALRQRFLEEVSHNVRARDLARVWGLSA